MTFILSFLLIFFGLSWLVNKLLFGGVSAPPTQEELIEQQKAQEGTVHIYKNDNASKPAKPTIQDLGQDVEFEEVNE
ncbi:MAG: hypothetical protein MJZ66_08345 [Bacteroidales bacterium]|nr:hypothetical protein [Bacteroidales bacterium]